MKYAQKIGVFIFFLLILTMGWLVPRSEFEILIILYTFSFGLYYWIMKQSLSDRFIIGFGFLLRIGLLFAIPALSNDVYRFIWDGRLLVAGEDPFALRPSEWMTLSSLPIGINNHLQKKIYSDNYTVYPPIHQVIFWLSAKLSWSLESAIILLKLVLILGEIGLLLFFRKAKEFTILNTRLLPLYALNPLVLLEISGNGHFEGLMTLFLLIGFWGLRKKKYGLGGIGFGLAIATKLLPLMLLPIVLKFIPKKGLVPFFCMIIFLNIFLWFPLWQMGSLHHLMDSIWLYFESFEFNASLFYLLKWIYPSGRIGLMTNSLTILLIAFLALRQRKLDFIQLLRHASLIWILYLLNAAIVHPWYLIPVLVLSGLTKMNSGVIWTGLVYLSYSHYWGGDMEEQLGIIALEYLILTYLLVMDYKRAKLGTKSAELLY